MQLAYLYWYLWPVLRVLAKLRYSQINRRDFAREVMVEADTAGRPAGDIGAEINQLKKTLICHRAMALLHKARTKIWLNPQAMP